MLNVVCSEYCSEFVVTCFVCKELTLNEFEGIVGDTEGYVNSSAESVVTCFVCKELNTEGIRRQQEPDLSSGKDCTAKAINILSIPRVDSLLKFPHFYGECCLFGILFRICSDLLRFYGIDTGIIQRQQGPDMSNGKDCTTKTIQILSISRVDSLLNLPYLFVECCLF